MISSLKRSFQIRLCHLIDNLVLKYVPQKTKVKTVLIIRLDAIGDYILFRNYLEVLSKSKKYKAYKITLCGNKIWKPLAQEWDSEFVDSFIWLDRKKFYHDPVYRFKFQKQIRKQGFEVVLSPIYSRLMLFGDSIVKISGAKQRIGNFGNTDNLIPKEKKIADKYYSNLFLPSDKIIFEFDRNKEFFENLLEEKIDLKSPQIKQVKKNKKPYLVVFAGASEEYRRWNWKSFAQLAIQLAEEYNWEIKIMGAKLESEIGVLMSDFFEKNNQKSSKPIKFINLTNKTSLLELSQIIANSSLLLSNDTSAIHFAVATESRAICFSNGWHFGRFNPYPKNYETKTVYIYPPEIEKIRFNEEKTALKYCNSRGSEIDAIEIEAAFEAVETILKRF